MHRPSSQLARGLALSKSGPIDATKHKHHKEKKEKGTEESTARLRYLAATVTRSPSPHLPQGDSVFFFYLSPESFVANGLTIMRRLSNDMKVVFAQFMAKDCPVGE
jgi:hypothetical protein